MLSDTEMNVSAAKDCRGVGKEGKNKSVYNAGRFWKALRALEKQVNPAPWLLYGTDVIWLCTKASAFSSFVQLQNYVTPKHKKVPLCWALPCWLLLHIPPPACVPPLPKKAPSITPLNARHLSGFARAPWEPASSSRLWLEQGASIQTVFSTPYISATHSGASAAHFSCFTMLSDLNAADWWHRQGNWGDLIIHKVGTPLVGCTTPHDFTLLHFSIAVK